MFLFVYLFIYSFIYLFIYSFIHLFIYLFIYLFVYLFIYLFFACINISENIDNQEGLNILYSSPQAPPSLKPRCCSLHEHWQTISTVTAKKLRSVTRIEIAIQVQNLNL